MLKQRITALERQVTKRFPTKDPDYSNPLWINLAQCATIEEWLLQCEESEQAAEEIQRRRDAGIDFPILALD